MCRLHSRSSPGLQPACSTVEHAGCEPGSAAAVYVSVQPAAQARLCLTQSANDAVVCAGLVACLQTAEPPQSIESVPLLALTLQWSVCCLSGLHHLACAASQCAVQRTQCTSWSCSSRRLPRLALCLVGLCALCKAFTGLQGNEFPSAAARWCVWLQVYSCRLSRYIDDTEAGCLRMRHTRGRLSTASPIARWQAPAVSLWLHIATCWRVQRSQRSAAGVRGHSDTVESWQLGHRGQMLSQRSRLFWALQGFIKHLATLRQLLGLHLCARGVHAHLLDAAVCAASCSWHVRPPGLSGRRGRCTVHRAAIWSLSH